MEPKDIKIECPEGYTYELVGDTIKFKKKEVSWKDILEAGKYSHGLSDLLESNKPYEVYSQFGFIKTYVKLHTIARYFNGDGWVAEDFKPKYSIRRANGRYTVYDGKEFPIQAGTIYFRTLEDACHAIRIMGEDLKYLF